MFSGVFGETKHVSNLLWWKQGRC